MSREALTLELAQPGPRTDEEIDALHEGLLAAVKRMKDDGTLPKASDLVDEALENADLNGFVEALIKALPDSVIDGAVKVDDILTRAIDDLDLREVLAEHRRPGRSQRSARPGDREGGQGLARRTRQEPDLS